MFQEKINQIAAILSNEENAKALAATATTEEAIAWFAAQGIEMTAAEIDELAAGLAAAAPSDELDENALEIVSGGSITAAAVGIFALKLIGSIGIAHLIKWGIKKTEKKFGIDLNGDGKIG